MRLCWITFHKNLQNYPEKWITDYVNSYHWQTFKIPIYEINYGGKKNRLFKDSQFYSKQFDTHADAHNFILDEVFKDGFDYAFNSNIDDIYEKTRIEIQASYLKGHDIISCNHSIINGDNEITKADIRFSDQSPGQQFQRVPPHNIISHPGVVYSKRFWENCPKLNPKLIPIDDLDLWLWAYNNGYQFKIVPHVLVYYRVHENSVAAPRRKEKI